MLYVIPPNIFESFIVHETHFIIWFEDPQDTTHRNILNLLSQNANRYFDFVCLKIYFHSADYNKHFKYIKDQRTILFLKNNRIIGRYILTDISQIQIIFQFFEQILIESNNFIQYRRGFNTSTFKYSYDTTQFFLSSLFGRN